VLRVGVFGAGIRRHSDAALEELVVQGLKDWRGVARNTRMHGKDDLVGI
jgi:hypothetical protein